MTIAQKLEIRNEHHYLWTGRRFQVDSQVMQDVYFLPTSRVKIIIMQISSLKNYIFAISIFSAPKKFKHDFKTVKYLALSKSTNYFQEHELKHITKL